MVRDEPESDGALGDGAAEPSAVKRPAGRPKRLPGLWVLCVLFGLAGMFWLCAALIGTLLGVLVFGGLSALSFAIAAGLWVRSNAVRLAVMGVLGAAAALFLIGFLARLRYSEAGTFAVLFCVNLAIVAYLWFRRRQFKVPAAQKPRLTVPSGLIAGGIVLVIGVGGILVALVDDPREEFPELAYEPPQVSEEDNGYFILKEMAEDYQIGDDERFDSLLRLEMPPPAPEPSDAPPEWYDEYIDNDAPPVPVADSQGPSGGCCRGIPQAPGPQWVGQARELLASWDACIARADELVARPRLALPPAESHAQWISFERSARIFYLRRVAELLCIRSAAQLADGEPQAALNSALAAVRLGQMVLQDGDALMTWLFGQGILHSSLAELRRVAASPLVGADMLEPALESLPTPRGLRGGLVRALRAEFTLVEQGYRALSVDAGYLDQSSKQRLLRTIRHALKPNMTHNLLGAGLTDVLARTKRYTPRSPWPSESDPSLLQFIRQVGYLHFARNLVGDSLTYISIPSFSRYVDGLFDSLAKLELTRVFLALRCYELEHGALPGTLTELAPEYLDEVPLDPFTEAPFGYEPAGDRPRIYSVGPDQQPDAPEALDAEEGDDLSIPLSFARD